MHITQRWRGRATNKPQTAAKGGLSTLGSSSHSKMGGGSRCPKHRRGKGGEGGEEQGTCRPQTVVAGGPQRVQRACAPRTPQPRGQERELLLNARKDERGRGRGRGTCPVAVGGGRATSCRSAREAGPITVAPHTTSLSLTRTTLGEHKPKSPRRGETSGGVRDKLLVLLKAVVCLAAVTASPTPTPPRSRATPPPWRRSAQPATSAAAPGSAQKTD